MKCDNVENGCTWVGTVGTLEEHVATCKFTLLPCPKECKDDSDKVKQFMRKDLDKHLKKSCPNRDYSCKHCGEKSTYASIKVHDKTCKKKMVTCPKDGCSEKMPHFSIPWHLTTTCEHAVTPCKYSSIGCGIEMKRKDMAAHELNSDIHLHLALDKIHSQQEERQYGEPIKFKLTDYQKKKEDDEVVESPLYYIPPNGYRMALRVDAHGVGKGTHIMVSAAIIKGRYDAQLKWPFIGNVTFTLLNQLEDKNHYQVTMELTAIDNAQAGGSAWGKTSFIRHSALDYDAVNNTQYLKDDTLYFRMSVKPADHKPWLQ